VCGEHHQGPELNKPLSETNMSQPQKVSQSKKPTLVLVGIWRKGDRSFSVKVAPRREA